ncbi:MAG: hypothetical protein ACW98F_14985 [Candidatus Hodarchaeales archaeon]|jgi:hypothetical protein
MENEILIVLTIMFALQIVILYIVTRKLRKEKELGYPLQDEMSKMLMYKAGAYSFWMSWPLWLAIMIFSSLTGDIRPNWEIYFGIIGMMFIYIITNVILKKRGV